MKQWLIVMGVLGLVLMAEGQEYGRGSLSGSGASAGLGRAPLPAATYDGFWDSGSWGVKPHLGWAYVSWDVGSASGSDWAVMPQLSIFYKPTDNLDVNLSAMYVTAEDRDDELGDNEAEMARLALGIRYWFDTGRRFTPYLGGGIGYYFVDGDTDRTRQDGIPVAAGDISVDNGPGCFLEGGVAFQIADNFYINTEVTYDFLLGSSDAEINGRNEDYGVSALSIGLGATWMF